MQHLRNQSLSQHWNVPESLFIGLPEALDVDIDLREEQLPMESETPKNDFVVLLPLEVVPGIPKDNVWAINVICMTAYS